MIYSLKEHWVDDGTGCDRWVIMMTDPTGQEAAGSIVAEMFDGEGIGWIRSLYVDGRHRRKGYARQLLHYAMLLLYRIALMPIQIWVEDDSPEWLKDFYRGEGFESYTGGPDKSYEQIWIKNCVKIAEPEMK